MMGMVTSTGTWTITEWNKEQTSDTLRHVSRSEERWRKIFSRISGGRWESLVLDIVMMLFSREGRSQCDSMIVSCLLQTYHKVNKAKHSYDA